MPFSSPDDYLDQISRLSPYYEYFQLDFADGVLVEEKTAPLRTVLEILARLDNEKIKNCVFDIHLMEVGYEKEISVVKNYRAGLKIGRIFIHLSVLKRGFLGRKKDDFEFGLVLSPEDEVSRAEKDIDIKNVPAIQIMSVIPGAQGRPFIPETLNKIDQLRSLNYRNKIFLDGAVNDKTLPTINSRKFKPDVVCPGSFLTKSPDNELKKRVNFLLSFE